jgi:SAM-dependent methyltransferase
MQTLDLEKELYDAVHAYIPHDLPGTKRTPEFNEGRVRYRMGEETTDSVRRHVRRVLDLISPPARILEIGCGTGGWCTGLALAGFDVVGIEPNEHGVRACRTRALRYPHTRQEFHVARGESLPFPDESFDAVVSSQVCEHVPDRAKLARECVRVLRPGGVMQHIMPSYAFPWEPHYRIPWPPRASRTVARLWLRAIGRDTRLFDEEIFPTLPGEVMRTFRDAGLVDVRDAYADVVAAKFDRGEFSRPWLTSAVRVLRRVGAVRLLRGAVLRLELYSSIMLTGRKP